MASFNSLPSELVARIVDLSIEDFEVLERTAANTEKIQLNLSNLSLVSNIFTLPAQKALWRRIYSLSTMYSPFAAAITQGIGQNKRLELLQYALCRDDTRAQESLVKVLNSVCSVDRLLIYDFSGEALPLPRLFSIPSLRALKKLSLEFATLNVSDTFLPTTLHSITTRCSASTESLLLRLPTSLCVIDTISFKYDYESSIRTELTFTHILLSYFKSYGSNLKRLDFGRIFPFPISTFLSYTPSLLHLNLIAHETQIQLIINQVKGLPITTRLLSIYIGTFTVDTYTGPKFLLPLLALPQLSQLKVLTYEIDQAENDQAEYVPNLYGSLYEEGHLVLKLEEEGERIKIALDESVNLCKERGIRLSFLSEKNDRIILEERRQKLYESRQKELDKLGEIGE